MIPGRSRLVISFGDLIVKLWKWKFERGYIENRLAALNECIISREIQATHTYVLQGIAAEGMPLLDGLWCKFSRVVKSIQTAP